MRLPLFSRSADEMPFLDHLEELRWRILWSLIALVVGTLIGFGVVTTFDVMGWLIRPVEPLLDGERLKYLSPADPFFIVLKLSLTVGLLLALPVIVQQAWSFVSPALLPREKRAIVPALYFGLVLFAAGVALAYFVVLPLSLQFLSGFLSERLEQSIVADAYLGFVVKLLLAFGFMFELPVVMLVLTVLGVVDARMLKAGRRYALVINTIASSLITPGDLASTILLMVPMAVLYELSIVLAAVVERRRARADAEAEAEESGQWAGV